MAPARPADEAAGNADLGTGSAGEPVLPALAPIEIRNHDPTWPQQYEREAARIRSLLGDQVARLEHVGSTSVPGLAAKPIIDIVLEVPDSADEATYLPTMQAAGYKLRLREPEWFQHRLLNGPDTDINLHVFSAGCPETDQMLWFRDRLRNHAGDRELYLAVKRQLAGRNWTSVQRYADAKTTVIEQILARARPPDNSRQENAEFTPDGPARPGKPRL